MVNTLAAMHNLKDKKLTLHKPFHKQSSRKTFVYGSQPVLNTKTKNGLKNSNETYTASFEHHETGFSN
jgi:hypothetical protein